MTDKLLPANQYSCSNNKVRSAGRVFWGAFLITALFLSQPTTTNASFMDFISNLFSSDGTESAEAALSSETAQTMDLMSVLSIVNPLQSESEGINIVEEDVLESINSPTDILLADGTTNGKISTYTVRQGDSFATIAKMFGVSVNTVLWANDLNSKSVIKEGQKLVILPITGIMHTVKSGDTINSIAKKYKGEADEIADFNGLKVTDKLAIGDEILIPDGEATVVAPTTSRNVATGALRGAGGPAYDGYYIRPVAGGRRSQGLHGYNGVDIASSIGTPILASASGVVIISKSSGYNGGYGQYIVVQHSNGTQTLYGHLSKNYVAVGATVTQGDVIGAMGNTGRSTGSHVHFEIRGAKNPF